MEELNWMSRLSLSSLSNEITICNIIEFAKQNLDAGKSSSQRALWNDSQNRLLLQLLQCFPRAQRGGWSKGTWKIVAQVMKEKFPESNFTIQQLIQQEQNLQQLYNCTQQVQEGRGRLSVSRTTIIPFSAAPVALHEGPHVEGGVEIDSATTQIGTGGDTDNKAQGITDHFCGSLSPPKGENGFMNNLNSSSTIPQRVVLENLHVQPENFHSFTLSSTNIPPRGISSLNDCENKNLSSNDSDIARNQSLSAPLRPDPASNSQQLKKHDSFPRKNPMRRVRGKPKCKKVRPARSNFSMMRCLRVVNKLPEFKECDREHLLEIFSDELYREAFLAMNRTHKVFWLRSKLDKEKENRSLAKSVARICI